MGRRRPARRAASDETTRGPRNALHATPPDRPARFLGRHRPRGPPTGDAPRPPARAPRPTGGGFGRPRRRAILPRRLPLPGDGPLGPRPAATGEGTRPCRFPTCQPAGAGRVARDQPRAGMPRPAAPWPTRRLVSPAPRAPWLLARARLPSRRARHARPFASRPSCRAPSLRARNPRTVASRPFPTRRRSPAPTRSQGNRLACPERSGASGFDPVMLSAGPPRRPNPRSHTHSRARHPRRQPGVRPRAAAGHRPSSRSRERARRALLAPATCVGFAGSGRKARVRPSRAVHRTLHHGYPGGSPRQGRSAAPAHDRSRIVASRRGRARNGTSAAPSPGRRPGFPGAHRPRRRAPLVPPRVPSQGRGAGKPMIAGQDRMQRCERQTTLRRPRARPSRPSGGPVLSAPRAPAAGRTGRSPCRRPPRPAVRVPPGAAGTRRGRTGRSPCRRPPRPAVPVLPAPRAPAAGEPDGRRVAAPLAPPSGFLPAPRAPAAGEPDGRPVAAPRAPPSGFLPAPRAPAAGEPDGRRIPAPSPRRPGSSRCHGHPPRANRTVAAAPPAAAAPAKRRRNLAGGRRPASPTRQRRMPDGIVRAMSRAHRPAPEPAATPSSRARAPRRPVDPPPFRDHGAGPSAPGRWPRAHRSAGVVPRTGIPGPPGHPSRRCRRAAGGDRRPRVRPDPDPPARSRIRLRRRPRFHGSVPPEAADPAASVRDRRPATGVSGRTVAAGAGDTTARHAGGGTHRASPGRARSDGPPARGSLRANEKLTMPVEIESGSMVKVGSGWSRHSAVVPSPDRGNGAP